MFLHGLSNVRMAIATLAVLVQTTGCKCSDSSSTKGELRAQPVNRADPRYPHALIKPTCETAAGARLLLVVAKEGSGCGPAAAERVTISIATRPPPLAPVSITLGQNGSGSAVMCPAGGAICTPAKSGRVQLDRYDEKTGAAGVWDLTLEDGRTESGSFDAVWCDAECAPPPG